MSLFELIASVALWCSPAINQDECRAVVVQCVGAAEASNLAAEDQCQKMTTGKKAIECLENIPSLHYEIKKCFKAIKK
jgi:hypothetical protein